MSSIKLPDAGLLVLRVGIGLGLFLLHGQAKLASAWGYAFAGQEWKFVDVVAGMGFPLPAVFAASAALAESIGALLLAVGLLSRPAGAAVAFTMLVAISRHVSAGEKPELAALYFLPAIALALTGPGQYSLDHLWAHSGGRTAGAFRAASLEVPKS